MAPQLNMSFSKNQCRLKPSFLHLCQTLLMITLYPGIWNFIKEDIFRKSSLVLNIMSNKKKVWQIYHDFNTVIDWIKKAGYSPYMSCYYNLVITKIPLWLYTVSRFLFIVQHNYCTLCLDLSIQIEEIYTTAALTNNFLIWHQLN